MDEFLEKISNMDGSSELLLFLIILVFLMLVSIFVINKITKNKLKKVVYTNPRLHQMNKLEKKIPKEEPIIEKKEQTKTLEKIEKDEKEIEEIIRVEEKTSIDDIEKLLEEGNKLNPINLTEFEEEQEANAIISYDELVKRAGAKKIVYECEYSNDNTLSNDEIKESNERKFIASKVISPIYGVQKEKTDDIIDLEDFRDDEYQSEKEMDETFLKTLKEFRSELN